MTTPTTPTARATWTERRLTVSHGSTIGVTVRELDSGVPGPRLLVLGGVHGDEVGGIVAAGRASVTDWPLTSGVLTIVPIAHEAARGADTRESPIDGGNLARSFPGSLGAGATQELAWIITNRLISRSDVLIDLHTSSPGTDMPLFVGCLDDGSPASSRAVELALATAMPVLWTHPDLGPGRTLTTARDLDIPALYVESPAGGVLDESHLAAYADVVRSVMESLGMLEGASRRTDPPVWLHGNGDVDTFTATTTPGLFIRESSLMSLVRRGDRVGAVIDEFGRELETILAPKSGYITTLRRSAVVEPGLPVVGVTGLRPPSLGVPSDAFVLPRKSQP